MSTLQCANIHFESTANNRVQYFGSNNIAVVVGGANSIATNTTVTTITGNTTINKSLTVSADNTTGGGIILSDDGDIVDLNDGFASMRFTNGVRIYSGNKTGSSVITLGNDGNLTLSGNIVYPNSIPSPKLLSTITVTGGASISSTNALSGFNDYLITFENVVPATSAAGVYMRWYAGGSYRTSGYTTYMAIFNTGGSAGFSPTTYIDLIGGGRGSNSSGRGWIGRILLLNAAAASGNRQCLTDTAGLDSSTAAYARTWGGGELNVAASITGFQIYASSGNITGTANIYGLS